MTGAPLVTAILPSWNSERFIGATLDSLAAQTHPNMEIVIGDDASTDATPEILRTWAAPRDNVTLVLRRDNLGWVGNCNDLMARARGKYMFFAFHDDQIDPTYAADLAALLEEDPGAILSFAVMRWVGTDGGTQLRDGDGIGSQDTAVARAKHMIEGTPRWGVPNRGLFRAEAFRRIGGMKTHAAGEFGADFPWLLHMLLLGRFAHLPEPRCTKVMRQDSLSRSWRRSGDAFIARDKAAFREVMASGLPLHQKAWLGLVLRRASRQRLRRKGLA